MSIFDRPASFVTSFEEQRKPLVCNKLLGDGEFENLRLEWEDAASAAWMCGSRCSGKTERLTLKECQEKFGKAEFLETAHGYAPHIVANQV